MGDDLAKLPFAVGLSRAARGVIRDVGRVLGYSYQETDQVAKLVPMELNMTLEKALQQNPQLSALSQENPRVKRLLDSL